LIVSHHPIIFKGLKKLTGHNYVERTVIKAIKNDIAIYAIHTNLDNVSEGVNKRIADKIGLVNRQILVPKVGYENQEIGSGMIGELVEPIEPMDFLLRLKNTMNTDCLRYTSLPSTKIKKVALCGGSGSFLLNDAICAGADVFISADFKYHEFFDADNNIIIADIGHYESEQFTKELLQEVLTKKFPTFAINFSKTLTNPISYL
jgi:dinuclear metal center YbgI/SA1388 family protein